VTAINDRPRPRFRRFLAMAVLLHAAVLLAPVLRWMENRNPATVLEVRLQPSQPQPVRILPPARIAIAGPPSVTPGPAVVAGPALPQPPAEPPRPPVGSLLDQVARMDWSRPEPAIVPVGRPVESAFYARFRRPVLERRRTLFDHRQAPRAAEVLDRWLEPGGTQRVVVNTPSGETLCGRQAAVDVFRPWLQMPMLFHRCGGGGERRTP